MSYLDYAVHQAARVLALDKAITANPDASTDEIVDDAVAFERYLLGARALDADEREFTIQIASEAGRLLESARPSIETIDTTDTTDSYKSRVWRSDRDRVIGQLNELIINLKREAGS